MVEISAVILAGGLGTRLRCKISDRPKSLASICGKPFLEYQINFLKKQGVTNIILCTGFLGKQVIDHFSTGKKFGVRISYSNEKELLGTGGAIKNAIHMVQDKFLLLNGDSIVIFDIEKLIDFHNTRASDTTIVLSAANQSQTRYGNVLMDKDNKITSFTEKKDSSSYFSAGVYLMEKNSIPWGNFPSKFSIESELFPYLVKQNNIYGFVTTGYFIDIGIPDDYEKFENHVLTNYCDIMNKI